MSDIDPTENVRRMLVHAVNYEPGSREALVQRYGAVWDTEEMQRDFRVHAFAAPFVMVTRLADNKRGTLMFQHHERFYFSFEEA